VKIELRIDAKPSELDGLGEKLRKLLDDIKAPQSTGVRQGISNT